jgi:uncharacterized protein (TIGR02271 family)
MAYETIVAVFDTAAHADAAVRALTGAGFPSTDISTFNRERLTAGTAAAGAGAREAGLWHRLFGGDIRQHEAQVYGHAVESGGVVVSLRVPDTQVAHALGVLDVHKPVDVSERAATIGAASPALVAAATPEPPPLAAKQTVAPAARAAGRNEEVIRLAEEHLDVGKRQVQAGTTRIRRFVTTKPVEAQVTLHEEHADVMRRAVADPEFLKDIDWADKTIEVTETAEEAVVSKTARVAEEIVVRREGSDRVETVRETVRRQQAEVERVPSGDVKKPGPRKE